MRIRKPMLTGLATLAVLTGSLAISSAPALALETRFKEAIGEGVLAIGRLPVAVNNGTGEVYVDNVGGKTIVRFDSSGQLLESFPNPFFGESTIAIDNSTGPNGGDLYLASENERVVELLGSSGAPVSFKATAPYINGSELTGTPTGPPGEELVPFSGPRGIAVDANGDVYVSDGGVVSVFSSEGVYQRRLEVPPPSDSGAVAVATDGTTYVVNGGEGGVVDVFNAKGEYERQLAGTPTGPSGEGVPFTDPLGVAVDNSTSPSDPSVGDVYVADHSFSKSAVDGFNATGEYESQITETPSGLFGPLTSAAVDGNGDIYVGDGNDGVVDVFTPTTVTLPDVTTGAASNVQHTTATVVGGVNPDGIDAKCYVEYNGAKAPCAQEDVGSGSGEVHVKAELTGLSPRSTTYKYKVCAVNFNEIPNCGKSESFTTLPDKPTIASESGVSLSPREASLNGAVNPETGVATYHFAYGPTSSYGQRFPSAEQPVGGGEAPIQVHGFSIGGLQPGSTYHYALVATNAAGTTYGPDQTFTTPAGPVPSVATGGVSGVSQNAATVAGVVDPGGVPTTYEFDLGTDTSYGTRVFGDAGAGVEVETLTASFQSLLPDTTYHYRLLASNAFATIYGADQTFTTPAVTSALPAAPAALALVALPNVAFPSEAGATNTTTTKKALTNAQKLIVALRKCKKAAKKQQAACERQARKRYAPVKRAAKARNVHRVSGKRGV